jgi:biofilm PGA synthesis N-glycosyltransferase PgaC
MIITFWICLFIIFYAFVGYGMILFCMVRIRRMLKGKRTIPTYDEDSLLPCTLIIAAYNEEDFIREKISNTLALEYPPGKLEILFITDGSSDNTPGIIAEYPGIRLMHQPERRGKVAAIHRAVEQVNTPILIFTDANTLLNKKALIHIARHYQNAAVGAVAGEKRIHTDEQADAGSAGEGFYWKYESLLKKWDSELHSVVGAAGELFSVRADLYTPVSEDTILDDFMISMLIASKGYRIVYEPDAYAVETASENIREELKRKIRIAAGGIQSIVWLSSLLNIFRHGLLSFQYISHRVLRWAITPLLLLLIFILNLLIVLKTGSSLYSLLFAGQLLFYFMAFLGFLLENRALRVKVLFIPYYFCVMNYAALMGMIRYFGKKQSSAWEKARRRAASLRSQ